MAATDQGFHNSNRKVQTYIPTTVEMSIREVDWRRVYRSVTSIPRPTSKYQLVASFFYGVSASAAVSLIPLYQSSTSTESWVKPTTWLITLSTVAIAILAQHFATKHEQIIQTTCEAVMRDMRDIYATFFPEGSLDDDKGR